MFSDHEKNDDAQIDALIERSSLGTQGAQRLRDRIPVAEGRRIQDFAWFYREHLPRLVAYLSYLGASAHLAADLAQDAMLAVYQRWDTTDSPKAYVWKAAGRAFLKRIMNVTEDPLAEPKSAAVSPKPEAAETWLQEQQIIAVMRTLPPRQRQVLALSIDGWEPDEIADLLSIDPSTVRSNLLDARRNAAEHLRRLRKENSWPD